MGQVVSPQKIAVRTPEPPAPPVQPSATVARRIPHHVDDVPFVPNRVFCSGQLSRRQRDGLHKWRRQQSDADPLLTSSASAPLARALDDVRLRHEVTKAKLLRIFPLGVVADELVELFCDADCIRKFCLCRETAVFADRFIESHFDEFYSWSDEDLAFGIFADDGSCSIHLLDLPADLLQVIALFLPLQDLASFGVVNREICSATVRLNEFWKSVFRILCPLGFPAACARAARTRDWMYWKWEVRSEYKKTKRNRGYLFLGNLSRRAMTHTTMYVTLILLEDDFYVFPRDQDFQQQKEDVVVPTPEKLKKFRRRLLLSDTSFTVPSEMKSFHPALMIGDWLIDFWGNSNLCLPRRIRSGYSLFGLRLGEISGTQNRISALDIVSHVISHWNGGVVYHPNPTEENDRFRICANSYGFVMDVLEALKLCFTKNANIGRIIKSYFSGFSRAPGSDSFRLDAKMSVFDAERKVFETHEQLDFFAIGLQEARIHPNLRRTKRAFLRIMDEAFWMNFFRESGHRIQPREAAACPFGRPVDEESADKVGW